MTTTIALDTAGRMIIHKRTDACAFERHRQANVCAFVLGRGQREDGADGIVVGNSGAHGNVHHGRSGAYNAKGNADNIIC